MKSRFWAFFLISSILPSHLPAQSLDSDPSAQADLLGKEDEILQAVSRISGLPIRQEVAVDFKDLDFFQGYYRVRLERQYPPRRLAAVEKAYGLLGFLRPGDRLIDAYLRSFVGDVEGLYDPDTKTLYLREGVPEEKQEMVLAHELTHALQDQSFPLDDYFGDLSAQTSDLEFAKSALVEGQAVEVAGEYEAQKESRGWIGSSGVTGLAALPPDRREGMDLSDPSKEGAVNFPYVDGSRFWKACLSQKGKRAEGDFFKNPPVTTRQIIHPEDYLSPRPSDAGVALGTIDFSGHPILWQDSLGEYGLFLILRQGLGDSKAWDLADGWRGDQWRLYGDSSDPSVFLVGRVEMGDAPSARALFDACREVFLKTKPTLGKINFGPQSEWFGLGAGGEGFYLGRLGRRVVWIRGVLPAGVLNRLRDGPDPFQDPRAAR